MQYQFLLDNLHHSDQIQNNLTGLGIPESHVHFVTERSEDYAGHQVHEASIIEERDIIHSSIQGAMMGLVVGMITSAGMTFFAPLAWQPGLVNIVFTLLLCIGFGGWIGGLYGISHRNYRINKFEGELQKGKAVMLVYSDKSHLAEMKKLIETQYPDAKYMGQESAFDNPFRAVKTAELTH